MRMRIGALGLVIFILLLASCTSAHRTLSYTAMQKDLNRLERTIRLTHPAMNRTISDSSLTVLKNKIERQLPLKGSVLEYASLIHPLIDTVQGGHIGMYPRGALWRHSFQHHRHTLPLSLKRLDNGKIVLNALKGGQDSMLLGAQVLRINGQSIDEIVADATLFSGGSDGPNQSGARNRAITKLPQHLRWRLGKQDSYNVLVRFENRDSLIKVLTPSANKTEKQKSQKRSKQRERTINYGYDPSRGVAIIDINSFSGYDPLNVIFPIALKGVLAKAKQDSAQTIILDLRGNGGGRSSNIRRVLSYFVQEETPLFEPWTFPTSGWQKANLANKLIFAPSLLLGKGETRRFGRLMKHHVKPNKDRFSGKLVVLIDSGTFSAASITASALKSSDRAILIGQEAGGNYHETYAGLFSMIGLRRTGLLVRMPHLLIPSAVDESKQPFGKTLQPDINIPVTIDDIIDHRDRVLLQALEFSNN